MKTALITGASRGIGAAVARRLRADGCEVVLNYERSRTQAEALAAELGGTALQADVSDPVQVKRMVDTVLEKFCQLDILVCCAGVAWQGLTQDMRMEEYRRIMAVDLDLLLLPSCTAPNDTAEIGEDRDPLVHVGTGGRLLRGGLFRR